MTEDGYGKRLAPAIFCCGAGTVRSDQWNRPRDQQPSKEEQEQKKSDGNRLRFSR